MIAIVGGTGRLGRTVAARLVAEGRPVRVIGRHPPDNPVAGAEFVAADVRTPSTLPSALAGADVVVSAMHGMDPGAGQSPAEVDAGGNRSLIAAARAGGAQVVLVSVIGARRDHPMELFRMKAAAEDELVSGAADWTIVRAAAFAELWCDIIRSTRNRRGVPRVFGRGANPINFVCVGDVATAVARAAVDRSLRGQVVEVGGPQNLTLSALARLATGQAAVNHVPRLALRVLSPVLAAVRPAQGRLVRQALLMDEVDLAFDPAASRAAFGWLPASPVTEVAAPRVELR